MTDIFIGALCTGNVTVRYRLFVIAVSAGKYCGCRGNAVPAPDRIAIGMARMSNNCLGLSDFSSAFCIREILLTNGTEPVLDVAVFCAARRCSRMMLERVSSQRDLNRLGLLSEQSIGEGRGVDPGTRSHAGRCSSDCIICRHSFSYGVAFSAFFAAGADCGSGAGVTGVSSSPRVFQSAVRVLMRCIFYLFKEVNIT